MSTTVSVNTYSHTATYVATKLLLSLKEIILGIGLDPAKLSRDWDVLEDGISSWLETRDLERVVLEIHSERTGSLLTRWDLEIQYGYTGDGTL